VVQIRDCPLLIVLPIFFFLSLYLNILGVTPKKVQDPPDWRTAFLIATAITGATITIITEGLSLINGISQLWVAILWTMALSLSIVIGITKGTFLRTLNRIKAFRISSKGLDTLILAIIIVIVLALGVVAWVSPPNNTDSLQYHVSRIVHWIQNGSLRHYPTAYNPQLCNTTFAETAILNLWVLWGSDQPVNMVQWFSMIGVLLGTTALAQKMGAGTRGQLLTAAFIISIPIGILQSTSTQSDYVTAFWLVCMVYFIVLSKERNLNALEWSSFAIAVGLGMLTKGTFYPYALPFLLWYFVPRLKTQGWRKTLLEALCLGAVVLFLNLGFWARNTITYGSPLGTPDWVERHTETPWRPQIWISGVVTKLALNFPTPWENINANIISAVRSLDNSLGIEKSDFSMIWSWNHEDLAGNPVHLLAIFTAVPILIWVTRKTGNTRILHYALLVLASFFMHAIVVGFDLFGVRFQLPFFILGALLVGIPLSQTHLHRISGILAFAFLFLSIPWVLFNSTRPIIGMRPFPEPMAIPCKLGCTSIGSVFTRSRLDLLYANWTPLREPITSAAELVKASGCQDVGLQIDSHHKEYLFLWSLGAAQGDVRVETIYPLPETEQYIDPDFKPCAVVCSICGEKTRIHGLERAGAFNEGISVFIGSGFTYDENP
jgi:hypothetical protein